MLVHRTGLYRQPILILRTFEWGMGYASVIYFAMGGVVKPRSPTRQMRNSLQ